MKVFGGVFVLIFYQKKRGTGGAVPLLPNKIYIEVQDGRVD